MSTYLLEKYLDKPVGDNYFLVSKSDGTRKWIPENQSSTFSYTGSSLTRIDYANGSYKVFTYSGSDLDYITIYNSVTDTTTVKTFTYSSGDLVSITIS